jgi:1-aminocyclopropane-1-carboxylate deaminase/D-cysteine desulfhydrase-like pyridoxal-dependent ACC family enzyme
VIILILHAVTPPTSALVTIAGYIANLAAVIAAVAAAIGLYYARQTVRISVAERR